VKLDLFQKAIRLQRYLKEIGSGRNKLYFQFEFGREPDKDIQAILTLEENKTLLSCDCKHGSIHYEAICSHKLAVLLYLFKKENDILPK